VFIPTAFLPGITGSCITVALTIAISVIFLRINALSLSPALSALLLRRERKRWSGWLVLIGSIASSASQHTVTELVAPHAIRRRCSASAARGARVGRDCLDRDCQRLFAGRDQGYYISRCNYGRLIAERTDARVSQIEEMLSKTPASSTRPA